MAVLCLRQKPSDHNRSFDSVKQNDWKIDVPTIGNIYRAAERVMHYFNGLGSFSVSTVRITRGTGFGELGPCRR
ncbi:hypothetical protein EV426DRAFT_714154 [Tirmania nivea]|nr:hypothetical protein EV426DRAFT_714154 [Tirmania nivea]